MHASVSRIILFTPSLIDKFIQTNSDICEYIYEDPYDHICRIDLKNKYIKGDITYKDYFEEMDRRFPIFDAFRSNPSIVIYNNELCLQFESEYEIFRKPDPNVWKYLEFNTEYIDEFLEMCLAYEKTRFYVLKYYSMYKNTRCNRIAGIHHGLVNYFEKLLNINIRESKIDNIPADLINTYSREFFRDLIKSNHHIKNKFSVMNFKIHHSKDFYTKVVSKNRINEKYDMNKIIELKEIAKSFMSDYDCIISGSAALAFFNLELDDCQRNFMPDDIDVFFTDEKEYNKCIEDYKDDIFICRPNNDSFGYPSNRNGDSSDDDSFGYTSGQNNKSYEVIYLPYKGAKINILLINEYNLEQLQNHFDIEFCALIWDGKSFDKSSNIAVSSAKHGVSFQFTETNYWEKTFRDFLRDRYKYLRYLNRIRKYEKRGYRFIYYTNDIKNQKEKEEYELWSKRANERYLMRRF